MAKEKNNKSKALKVVGYVLGSVGVCYATVKVLPIIMPKLDKYFYDTSDIELKQEDDLDHDVIVKK